MCSDVDAKSLLRALSIAVTAVPLDRALVLDLIGRGADPNTRDEYRETWFETTLGDHDLTRAAVELLIEAGADVNAESDEGGRPLHQACVSARADLVECLLAHGAHPNFVVSESESLLDYVTFDLWYCQSQAGTAWDREHHRERADQMKRIAEVLKAAGATSVSEMRTARLRDWVILTARDVEQVLTHDGYVNLSEVATLWGDWLPRWQDWCARAFDPGEDGFLAAPAGFDRRLHNAEGLALAREFKHYAGMDVRVDLYVLDPDSEEAFARDPSRISDVGGTERRAPLPFPHARYVEEPGFFVNAKARVSSDCSTVTPVLEFHIGSRRAFAEWTLNLEELERSSQGDGRYAMFVDADGVVVDVWVTWSAAQVLWHVPRSAPEHVNLTFTRAGYIEAVADASKAAYHVVRRARIAVDKHLHRAPQITSLGVLNRDAPTAAVVHAEVPCTLTPREIELCNRSRIWDACVRFAWCVNSRSLSGLRLAEHASMSGDRRPTLSGSDRLLDYLSHALSNAVWPDDGREIVAEIGHLWLSQEPCVLFHHGDSAVSLANVWSEPDGRITSIHYMTEPDIVGSVERLGVYPGVRARHHSGPATHM